MARDEAFESSAILRSILVVPKTNGHGKKGFGADQFALLATYRLARVVPDVDREAEAPAFDLATPDRLDLIAKHEPGDDIGTSMPKLRQQIEVRRLADKCTTGRIWT
jgi:hypothetical protein